MSREGIPQELKCSLADDGKFGQPAGVWGLNAPIHFKGEPTIHPVCSNKQTNSSQIQRLAWRELRRCCHTIGRGDVSPCWSKLPNQFGRGVPSVEALSWGLLHHPSWSSWCKAPAAIHQGTRGSVSNGVCIFQCVCALHAWYLSLLGPWGQGYITIYPFRCLEKVRVKARLLQVDRWSFLLLSVNLAPHGL